MMVFGDYGDYDDYEYNDYPRRGNRGGNRRAYGNGRPQRYQPREPRRNVNVNRKSETIGRRCVGRGAECITDFRFWKEDRRYQIPQLLTFSVSIIDDEQRKLKINMHIKKL